MERLKRSEGGKPGAKGRRLGQRKGKRPALKNLSLGPAFFLLAFVCVLGALLLAFGIWQVCGSLADRYPHGGLIIEAGGRVSFAQEPGPEQSRILAILTGIRLGAFLLLPVGGLALAAGLFYRLKLKPPIDALRLGTGRIQQNDLDFSIPPVSEDELGQVCAAFESMRTQLLETNQELWRQGEERRRLNAAFSHDLRNPVTVLKGTVRMMRQGRADEHALERLECYILRLEQYVEAMSGIQKLEQLPVKKKETALSHLAAELRESARLLAPSLELTLEVAGNEKAESRVSIDHGIFLTVAENLIGNAARFSRDALHLTLKKQEDFLVLVVGDNGKGYPQELLKKGPEPFWRVESAEGNQKQRPVEVASTHFGMGLYGCRILCMKHGGTLRLENAAGGGGVATAVFAAEQG